MNEKLREAFGIPDWLVLGAVVWTLEEEYCALETCMSCGHQPRRLRTLVPKQMAVKQLSLSAYLGEEAHSSVSVTGMEEGEYAQMEEVYENEESARAAIVRLLAEAREEEAKRDHAAWLRRNGWQPPQ